MRRASTDGAQGSTLESSTRVEPAPSPEMEMLLPLPCPLGLGSQLWAPRSGFLSPGIITLPNREIYSGEDYRLEEQGQLRQTGWMLVTGKLRYSVCSNQS